jgi:GPH family glycoside/pentoside/hexuronide:cation symporter
LGFVALNILIPSALSDIVDYGTWKFGVNRGASYFAAYTFAQKLVNATGAALALIIAGRFGFEPGAAAHNERGVAGLHLSIVWIPAGLMLVSLAVVSLIRFNARHHELIRRRLEARDARMRGRHPLPLRRV